MVFIKLLLCFCFIKIAVCNVPGTESLICNTDDEIYHCRLGCCPWRLMCNTHLYIPGEVTCWCDAGGELQPEWACPEPKKKKNPGPCDEELGVNLCKRDCCPLSGHCEFKKPDSTECKCDPGTSQPEWACPAPWGK